MEKNRSLVYYFKKFKPYIKSLVHKYRGNIFFSEEDIISWSHMAIVDSLDKVDYDRNPSAYVVQYIKNYVKEAYKETGNFIKLKSKIYSSKLEIKKINHIYSLDTGINVNSPSRNDLKLSDVLPSSLLGPLDTVEENERFDILLNEVRNLSDKHKEIIHRHIFNSETLTSIAKDRNVSVQYIHQTLCFILKDLRRKLLQKNFN